MELLLGHSNLNESGRMQATFVDESVRWSHLPIAPFRYPRRRCTHRHVPRARRVVVAVVLLVLVGPIVLVIVGLVEL